MLELSRRGDDSSVAVNSRAFSLQAKVIPILTLYIRGLQSHCINLK